ncbi:MAG: type II toxin-antitoxin system RelE/ParE family toxin [Thermoprotei archaeon]|nr:MAG: type II toxin-antitoxin system RelE/ParE family toxin [Thermoprotei archaeon]
MKIYFSRKAVKDFKRLPSEVKQRVRKAIVILHETPFPRGVKKLKGFSNTYRLRIGDYRIIYKILWDRNEIWILRIAHRREVYKR